MLHGILIPPSLAGRVCTRLDAGKRMIYQFRCGVFGPLAMFWLTITVARVVMGAVAWPSNAIPGIGLSEWKGGLSSDGNSK